MATFCLFRDDAYLTECTARVLEITTSGIVLDRTVFYATAGGQPGDRGSLVASSGSELRISSAVYADVDKSIITHLPAPAGPRPAVGEEVAVKIDWELRYRRMRMHTALHLLSAALPYPVTGGSVGDEESRLDFDIPDAGLDKDEITRKLMAMVAADAAVTARFITDAELAASPGLVKTMSVTPPMGSGRIRLIEIAGFDLQPCGGTHVRRTSEIGPIRVTQIEKKGRQNRRVRIAWA
jgi:misacylated tRNA(Ala) deacylase